TVTFTPDDSTNYTAATTTVELVVTKATPLITWTTPAAITYGAAVSAAQLNASANVAGTAFAYAPPAGTVLMAGTHTLSVTFTPNDTANYTTATQTVALIVTAAVTPTLTWPTPVPIVYGTALSAAQLNASATAAGSFVYAPPSGTVLPAGPHTLTVTFTPDD